MTTAAKQPPSQLDDPAAYVRYRRRQIGYGRWEPFTDAEPVRQHIRSLMAAGIGWKRVSDLTGVPRNTISYILYGAHDRTCKRVRKATARGILGLAADPHLGVTVPALGTRRRIQALAAAGWPTMHLARHIGTHERYAYNFLILERVTAETARAVAKAYDQLRDANPLEHGVSPHGVVLSQNRARRNNWAGPDYWDTEAFDDPDFQPAGSDDQLKRNDLAAIRRADVEHLASYGYTPEVIADRVDLELGTIRDLVNAWRNGKKRDRRKEAAA